MGDEGSRPGLRIRGLAVAALSVVALAIAAAALPEGSPFKSESGEMVVPRVPPLVGYALAFFGVVGAAAVLYLLFVIVGPSDDRLRRRRRWWASIAALMLMAAIAAVTIDVTRPFDRLEEEGRPPSEETEQPDRAPAPEARGPDVLGAAVTALAALALIAVTVTALYKRRTWTVEMTQESDDALVAEIEAGVSDLRSIVDPREAVIACYARMEQFFRAKGLERRASDTPFEFIARALRLRSVPGSAAVRLTRLFERARYSPHEVDESMRSEALASLEEVRTHLRRGDGT